MNNKKRELYQYLNETIESFRWKEYYTQEEEEKARAALIDLSQRLNTALIKQVTVFEKIDNHNYIYHLYTAQKALDEMNFCLACHELQDVLHSSVSKQVLTNIQAVIQPYLGEK